MSVLIKGMRMPRCCYECKLSTHTDYPEIFCNYLKMYYDENALKRPTLCPLEDYDEGDEDDGR